MVIQINKYIIKFLALLAALLLVQSTHSQCTDLTPQFTVNQNQFCGPGTHTINLTNTSTGANNTTADFEWYLNGTLVSNSVGLANPGSIQITTVGTHTIELVGIDSEPCTASTSIDIDVLPVPVSSFTFSPDGVCAETAISFNNTSTNTVAGTVYSWDFGDGNISSDENPTHTYTAGGTYTVTLNVDNGVGCTDSYSIDVTSLEIPLRNGIIGDDGDGNTTNCLLPGDPATTQSVSFSNNTTGATSYFWDFGDGNTSTDPNPSNLYTTYGTFPVTMTATGPNGCTTSETISVVFEKFVSSSLVLDVTEYSGCAPLSLTTLTNNSINASDFVWDFGDGSPVYNTTSPTPPNHIYTQAGNYTISLSASNSCNTANATISPIIIVDKPQVNFSLTGYNGCAPASIGFVNHTTGALPANDHNWDMGNGNTYNTTVTPPTQSYNESGVYTVSLTSGNACGDSTLTRVITLDTIPLASFDLLPDEGCSPLTVDINNTSTGNIDEYRWTRTGFGYSYGPTYGPFTYTYPPGNSPVTENVTLRVANSCGNTTVTKPIVIHRPTRAQFTTSATTVCLGGDFTFTNGSLGENLTYEWDFGDGSTSTTAGPHTINYTTPGTYDVRLVAKGYCGNDTITRTVVVHPPTVADMTPLDPIEGCSPMDVSFQNNSTGANLTYQWSVDGVYIGNSTDIGPINFTETPGNTPVNHTIQLRVNSACGVQTTETIVIVHRPTEAQMTVSSNEVCLGESITASQTSLGENLTYEWDFGDGSTSTTAGPHTINYAAPGTYDIRLIAKGYCGNDTITETVTVHPLTVADMIPLDPIEGCSPMDISFQNNSTGANLTYEWRLDGTLIGSSTDIGPINFTETPGNAPVNHTIQLRVNSACGVQTTETIVIVHRPTEAQMSVSPTEVCLGESFTTTQTSLGENLTYEWDFGDGSTSTTAGPHIINYAAPGTYDIRLIAKGYCGNDTITETVTVHPLTVADMIPLDPIEGCSPMDISFQNNSTGANLTYEWRLDGTLIGSSTDIGPINFTETPGNAPVNHTIQLRVNSACGVQTTETIVIVHRPTEAQMSVSPTEVCLGESFTATQTSLGENLTYEWDFGDGSTSTTAGPHTIDYSAAGTYDIQLVALGYCGNDTVRTSVTVHPFPIADFSPDLLNGCEYLEMTFTNNSTPTALQSWNFGPNASPAISTNFDPGTINFPDAGIEEIVLIVEENGCVSSDTNYIEVFPLPVLDFTLVPDEGCSDLEVQINNTSVDNGGETFTWNLGNGNTFTGYSPLDQTYIAINNDSIYDIQLIVTSGVGCEDSLTRQLIVHPVPVADFDFDLNPICQNTDAVFINNSTVGMAYEWDFGDRNTSNAFNPTHQYANDGTYTVRLVVNSPFTCSDTIFKDILVHPTAVPLFSATTACFGYETAFTDQSTGNVASWNWTFGDGGTSTDQNPSHLYPSAGNYSADLSVTTNFGCVTNLTLPVAVNEIPVADFSSVNFCHGDATAFTNLTSGATIGVEWDFADGSALNTMNNPSHTYTTVGDFDVRLVAFGGSGCSDTIIQTVTINPVPTADFSYLTVCAEDTTFFTDISGGNPDNYAWDFGNGTFDNTNNPNPEIVYLNDGTYTVSLTVDYTATGCSNSISYNVDAHPRTTPQFTATTACFETETAFTDASLNKD